MKNPAEIYEKRSDGVCLAPFSLKHDPMNRLLVANFEDDPDYNGIELQIFDDAVKGQGAILIMYRIDEKLDFYYTQGLRLDRKTLEVGGGVGAYIEQDFRWRFTVTERGLDAGVELTLHDGRTVVLDIIESRKKRGKGVTMLAPLGVSIRNPKYFPLFMMYDIDLVRQSGTKLVFRIGDNDRTIMRLPIPMPFNGKKVYFARYCCDPVIALFNQEYQGDVPEIENGEAGGVRYRLAENEGHTEIAGISIAADRHEVAVGFTPAVPDPACLADGAFVKGRFALGCDDDPDIIRGWYTVLRKESTVQISLRPDAKWMPRGLLTKITFLFFPSFFKTWAMTYRWQAEITFGDTPMLRSGWERVDFP